MFAGTADHQSRYSRRVALGGGGDKRPADPFGKSRIKQMSGVETDPEKIPALFDLKRLAENGLRRGYTTGTCATAAVKAALLKLVCNETPPEVNVMLPDSLQFLAIPIDRISVETDGAVRADVIKDGGDDPDQTHRARIFARVRRNKKGEIVFRRGEGV